MKRLELVAEALDPKGTNRRLREVLERIEREMPAPVLRRWYWRERRRRAAEDFWVWLARRLPRPLAYHATIRVGVHAATGPYSRQEVPALTLFDVLERWD